MSNIKADNFTWKTGESTAQYQHTVTADRIINGTCKMWVNYNGISGSSAVKSSYNVSSATYAGTGSYTIAFSIAIYDSNYSASDSVNRTYGNANGYGMNGMMYTRNTTNLSYYQTFYNGGYYDAEYIAINLFR